VSENTLFPLEKLHAFTCAVLEKCGLPGGQAETTARVLLAADRREIFSHGVARLPRYVNHLTDGTINPAASPRTVVETPVSLLIDGDGGMGMPLSTAVMNQCIAKARSAMIGLATVRNSNHYGIAGYYAAMALDAGMIGVSMTNAAPLVVPTFGKDALYGTNPIAVAVPAQEPPHFLMDMATSTVPKGKLEVSARQGQKIPGTWATDEHGEPCTDPARIIENLARRKGGGLLPLGGSGETNSGHKGFLLGLLVDIFCGVFSGGMVGGELYAKKGTPPGVAHFFAALNPAMFGGLAAIQANLTRYREMVLQAPPAPGRERIYFAGEKEYLAEQRNRDTVSVQPEVMASLRDLSRRFRQPLD